MAPFHGGNQLAPNASIAINQLPQTPSNPFRFLENLTCLETKWRILFTHQNPKKLLPLLNFSFHNLCLPKNSKKKYRDTPQGLPKMIQNFLLDEGTAGINSCSNANTDGQSPLSITGIHLYALSQTSRDCTTAGHT